MCVWLFNNYVVYASEIFQCYQVEIKITLTIHQINLISTYPIESSILAFVHIVSQYFPKLSYFSSFKNMQKYTCIHSNHCVACCMTNRDSNIFSISFYKPIVFGSNTIFSNYVMYDNIRGTILVSCKGRNKNFIGFNLFLVVLSNVIQKIPYSRTKRTWKNSENRLPPL